MMRGISNLVSALFIVAVILISAYSLTTAYLKYSSKIADAAKRSIERKMYANSISYSTADCNTSTQKITLKYLGAQPEFFVRFICYDERDPYNSLCVVPYIQKGVLSAKYISYQFPEKIELNIAACEELYYACVLKKIKCIAIGAHIAKEIRVVTS